MTSLQDILQAAQAAQEARTSAAMKQANIVAEVNQLFAKETNQTSIRAQLSRESGDTCIVTFGVGQKTYFEQHVTIKSYNNGKTTLIMPSKTVEVYSGRELKDALLDMMLQSYQNMKSYLDGGSQD